MNEDKQQVTEEADEMLPEYDFSQGVRGKHFREYQQGYTVIITHSDGTQTVEQAIPNPDAIVLDPDLRRYFPDSAAVNRTLRTLLTILPVEAPNSEP